MTRPSVARSTPCSVKYSGRTGSSAPNPSHTTNSATRSGRMSPQRSSQVAIRDGAGASVIESRQQRVRRAYPAAPARGARARGAGRPVYSTTPRRQAHRRAQECPSHDPSDHRGRPGQGLPLPEERGPRPRRRRPRSSRRAPSSACSARTARARPPPSGSSPRCSSRTRAAPRSRASTSGPRPTQIRSGHRHLRAVRRPWTRT